MSDAMKHTNRNLRRGLAVLTLSLVVLGCAGDPAIGGEGAPLLAPNVAPLPTAAVDSFSMAPDCAGRLSNVMASHFHFEVASLNAGLVAVVDGAGSVVCVDSVTDVQSDLDSSGQNVEADAVVAGFFAAVSQADASPASRVHGSVYAGDPEPQPNSQPAGRLPDPEPQPN